MIKLLTFLNLTHHRFRAVDGKQFFVNLSHLTSFENAGKIKLNLTEQIGDQKCYEYTIDLRGMFGCWLSYLFLMIDIAESGTNKPVVVLEDDNDLDVNFVGEIENALAKVPSDWDMILCGNCGIAKTSIRYDNLVGVQRFSCMNCFIVRNSTTAASIARAIDVKEISLAVDEFLGEFIKQGFTLLF